MSAAAKIIEPRWERRKDARPGELAAAALDLFVERGFAATRLDDVARRAGVSKGTLYLYFDSKDDLFKAVIREGYVAPIAEAEQLLDAWEGTSAELIREILRRWWVQVGATTQAGMTKLIIAEAGNFPELAKFYHDEVIQRVHALFERAIQRGVEREEFRPVNLQYAGRLACSPMVMLMLWKHSFALCVDRPMDPEDYVRTYADMLLNGLSQPGVASI
jgi:AcrR family transcriptional regulator